MRFWISDRSVSIFFYPRTFLPPVYIYTRKISFFYFFKRLQYFIFNVWCSSDAFARHVALYRFSYHSAQFLGNILIPLSRDRFPEGKRKRSSTPDRRERNFLIPLWRNDVGGTGCRSCICMYIMHRRSLQPMSAHTYRFPKEREACPPSLSSLSHPYLFHGPRRYFRGHGPSSLNYATTSRREPQTGHRASSLRIIH